VLLFANTSMASEPLPVDYHHYLNVFRGGDGVIQVQSRIIDRLDVKNAKIEILATVSIEKYGVWHEAKYDRGIIRIRVTVNEVPTNEEAGTLKFEYSRIHRLSESERLEFSGTTQVTDPGE
ncbi:MAG: hypothetical protein R3242_08040, partial [Akkermansiaceae bacterium]|nr:hypothetical protein [Akkermansiaceae bacterium]